MGAGVSLGWGGGREGVGVLEGAVFWAVTGTRLTVGGGQWRQKRRGGHQRHGRRGGYWPRKRGAPRRPGGEAWPSPHPSATQTDTRPPRPGSADARLRADGTLAAAAAQVVGWSRPHSLLCPAEGAVQTRRENKESPWSARALWGCPRSHVPWARGRGRSPRIAQKPHLPSPPPAAVPPARPGPTEAGSGQKVGLGPGAQFQDGWTTQRAVATSPRARVASLSSGTIPSLPRPTEAGTLAGWLGSARGEVSGPRGAWGTSVKPGSCGDNPHMQLPGLAFSTSKGPCARKVWSGPERWQGAVTAQGAPKPRAMNSRRTRPWSPHTCRGWAEQDFPSSPVSQGVWRCLASSRAERAADPESLGQSSGASLCPPFPKGLGGSRCHGGGARLCP